MEDQSETRMHDSNFSHKTSKPKNETIEIHKGNGEVLPNSENSSDNNNEISECTSLDKIGTNCNRNNLKYHVRCHPNNVRLYDSWEAKMKSVLFWY